MISVKVYEVGPRDGLQSLDTPVDTNTKKSLIEALYRAGIDSIEETSFVHPKLVPNMADAENVITGRGSALVLNKRGYERAKAVGVEKINIVISPCETFNLKNMNTTYNEIILKYRTFMSNIPKENVRVYISMAFGSPYSGTTTKQQIKTCIRDAKMFGDTVVFADTIGCANVLQINRWANLAHEEGMKIGLHLHHKGDETIPLSMVKAGIFSGITEFDSSIGGLGGCPFAEDSGANLSTETLVKHLKTWGVKCDIDESKLEEALKITREIKEEM
jgi:hydroxymethylglutaryl-CoA lyase